MRNAAPRAWPLSFAASIISAAAVSALAAAPAGAFSLPPAAPPGIQPRQVLPKDEGIHFLELDGSSAQVQFSLPCTACLGQQIEGSAGSYSSLLFNFQVFSSELPCGTSNLTLNGQPVGLEWDGTQAHSRQASVSSLPNPDAHELDLTWQSACLTGGAEDFLSLEETAQVISAQIDAVDGRRLESPVGFRVSFRQFGQPILLRLSTKFDPSDDGQPIFDEEWRNPPPEFKLPSSIRIVEGSKVQDLSIEQHIEELEQLRAQAADLREQIKDKKEQIREQIRKEGGSLRDEIKQCDSLTCIFKSVIHKIHGAFKVIYIRFFPDSQSHPSNMAEFESSNGISSQNQLTSSLPCPPCPLPADVPAPPPCHCRDDRVPPAYEDPFKDPTPPHDVPPHHPHGPHPHGFRPHRPRNPFRATLTVILTILGITALFAFIRRQCVSLRTKTDRRARREERRIQRQYRCAARRHAWQQWWSGRRGQSSQPPPTCDYDEKRALILQQEGVLEQAMQSEIAELQNAHGIVSSLVLAEEGRAGGPSTGAHPQERPLSGHVHQHAYGASRPVPIPIHPTPYTRHYHHRPPSSAASSAASSVGLSFIPHHGHNHSRHNSTNTTSNRHSTQSTSSQATVTPYDHHHQAPDALTRTPSFPSSLPSYRARANSYDSAPPPAYSSEAEDDSDDDPDAAAVVDGFRRYTPTSFGSASYGPTSPTSTAGSAAGSSIWTPGSSIPDVSPRASGESGRTGMSVVTGRSFII